MALQQRKLTEAGTSIHSLKKGEMKTQYNRNSKNPQDDSSGSIMNSRSVRDVEKTIESLTVLYLRGLSIINAML